MRSQSKSPGDRSTARDEAGLQQNSTNSEGDFTFLRPLKRGGVGNVYLVRDKRTKELVALKCMEKQEVGLRKISQNRTPLSGVPMHLSL